jgi:carboxyl-terminal processing protease
MLVKALRNNILGISEKGSRLLSPAPRLFGWDTWMATNRIKINVLGLAAFLTFALPSYAEPEPVAKVYLDQALELIRLHHRNSVKSDWSKIVARAHFDIVEANDPGDTHFAIFRVLQALGDRHSFLIPPSDNDAVTSTPQRSFIDVPMPSWRLEQKRYGLLSLPELIQSDTRPRQGKEYYMAARKGLIQMDKNNICGWVVDLRENSGGDMWPMLWGLDPLLGPSPFGAFAKGIGKREDWVRANGYIHATSETSKETPPRFRLKHANAPVAVLVGPNTGSAGEMTTIALIGRKDVRLFGNPTAGLTSANKTFFMSDGLGLVLTNSDSADRFGRIYTGPIVPDELVDTDKAMPAAIEWLETKC